MKTNFPFHFFKNLKKPKGNIDPDNLFDIVGCIGGLRGFGNDHARIAHHLGLNSETHIKQILDHLVEAKKRKPIPPIRVSEDSAPCKENILRGDQINLEQLPAPYLHEEDGGRYIQTYGMFILQTPDKIWTNWSIARAMIHDENHLTGLLVSPQHIRRVADQWKTIGRENSVPFALCFGVPPASILISSMPIPEGVSETDYVGSIVGEPIQVVQTETNELEVPAESEIVLEGTLDLDRLELEGPFGEMHGYVFPGTGHPCPTYTVEAMSYRNNAIMPVCNPGICTDETHTLIGSLISAEVKQLCRDHPILSKIVIDTFMPYESQALWLAFKINIEELVKLNTDSKSLANLFAKEIYGRKVGASTQEIILVGDDIDIFNFKKLMWAYVTRHTPGDDQYFYDEYAAFPLAPFISQGPRIKTKTGGNCVTDCIFPIQYRDPNFRFVTCDFESYDSKIRDKIDTNWQNYGYH
ncbi:hypothetical protein ZYGM_000516 [Zygosaccharomyces mellis]|uniref:Ferulic acid decarboxylase 1 n=1 Tax=Zygosaccharomyces mellis TaxID=42258 RepID=A0A4C2EIC0_9SACH|nr:hypothetical protein ZYGM_000516 [Zygosaccharomyces mellis]